MTVEKLPTITKIDYPTKVGAGQQAVVIWFANDTALRYVWDDERGEIHQQTYLGGVVHDSFSVGGNRDDLADYALHSVSEYKNEYRENPEACEADWTHIYEMLKMEKSEVHK